MTQTVCVFICLQSLIDTRAVVQAKQDAIARDKAAIESARLAKLAQLETVRAACKERHITVGYPMYTELRRTAALPFMHDVSIAGVP